MGMKLVKSVCREESTQTAYRNKKKQIRSIGVNNMLASNFQSGNSSWEKVGYLPKIAKFWNLS